MKTHLSHFIALAALAATAAACEQPDSAEAPDDAIAQQAEPLAERGAPPHRGHGPHARGGHRFAAGPPMLLHAALRELELSEAQRTEIEGALSELRKVPSEEDRRGGMEEHRKALAAAVRSGRIDEELLSPSGPRAEAHERMTRALATLHETLSAEQRAELVQSLEERMASGPEGKGPRGRRGSADKLLRGIDLTDEQRARIDAALEQSRAGEKNGDAMRAHHEALLAAFAKDTFDPGALVEPAPRGPFAALSVIVPLLDAAQRDQLAQRIEQGPSRHGRRMHHGGKRGPGPR